MNNRNGHNAVAPLVARVDELALALDQLGLALRDTWGPRLLDIERDVAELVRILRARATPTPDAGDEK